MKYTALVSVAIHVEAETPAAARDQAHERVDVAFNVSGVDGCPIVDILIVEGELHVLTNA